MLIDMENLFVKFSYGYKYSVAQKVLMKVFI